MDPISDAIMRTWVIGIQTFRTQKKLIFKVKQQLKLYGINLLGNTQLSAIG